MLLLTVIAAIIARFATNFANWKIAIALTLFVLVLLNTFDSDNNNMHLFFGLLFSPVIYAINHLFLVLLNWTKSILFN